MTFVLFAAYCPFPSSTVIGTHVKPSSISVPTSVNILHISQPYAACESDLRIWICILLLPEPRPLALRKVLKY